MTVYFLFLVWWEVFGKHRIYPITEVRNWDCLIQGISHVLLQTYLRMARSKRWHLEDMRDDPVQTLIRRIFSCWFWQCLQLCQKFGIRFYFPYWRLNPVALYHCTSPALFIFFGGVVVGWVSLKLLRPTLNLWFSSCLSLWGSWNYRLHHQTGTSLGLEWHASLGLKLPPAPSKPGLAWVWEGALFGQQQALESLMGRSPKKSRLLGDLPFSAFWLLQPAAVLSGTQGPVEGEPQGVRLTH